MSNEDIFQFLMKTIPALIQLACEILRHYRRNPTRVQARGRGRKSLIAAALLFTLASISPSVAADSSISEISSSWVDDVLRLSGRTTLPDGTWLNVAIQDKDGTLVADEGFICAQVRDGRFLVEGFTKDGIEPLPGGHYELSIQAQKGGLSVEKPITVTKRQRYTKSRLADVRAINVANYANARDNLQAATNSSGVSDFQREESDAQLRHSLAKKSATDQTSDLPNIFDEQNKNKSGDVSDFTSASPSEQRELIKTKHNDEFQLGEFSYKVLSVAVVRAVGEKPTRRKALEGHSFFIVNYQVMSHQKHNDDWWMFELSRVFMVHSATERYFIDDNATSRLVDTFSPRQITLVPGEYTRNVAVFELPTKALQREFEVWVSERDGPRTAVLSLHQPADAGLSVKPRSK